MSRPRVPLTRAQAFQAISEERDRQEIRWAGNHAHGKGSCASPDVAEPVKVAVLTEEVGEVARALLDGDRAGLETELVQVAAVAVAWLEALR